MARRRKKSKKARRFFVFGVTSIIFIGAMTFTIGRYWVDIISKYQEKKSLEFWNSFAVISDARLL